MASSDLDLHCLQRQGISGFSRTRVNVKDQMTKFMLFQWNCYIHVLIELSMGIILPKTTSKRKKNLIALNRNITYNAVFICHNATFCDIIRDFEFFIKALNT